MSLNRTRQKRIIWEEAFVLALERELILQVKESPAMAFPLTEAFQSLTTSDSPGLRWLSRLSTSGGVKGNPAWLSEWASRHHRWVMRGYRRWWKKTLHGLPESFWAEALSAKGG